MKLRTFALIVLLALFAAFVAVNWEAFVAPTTLSFVLGAVQAPLGLLLLGVIVLVAALFLLLIAMQQATVLMETRRTAKELNAQRALADQAESSRFTELRAHLDQVLQQAGRDADVRQRKLEERLDSLEAALRIHVEQTGNSLAASIGEVDDRIERLVTTPRLPAP